MNDIQKFLFETNDWATEKQKIFNKTPSRKEISSIKLSNAEAQIQAQMQAQAQAEEMKRIQQQVVKDKEVAENEKLAQ